MKGDLFIGVISVIAVAFIYWALVAWANADVRTCADAIRVCSATDGTACKKVEDLCPTK